MEIHFAQISWGDCGDVLIGDKLAVTRDDYRVIAKAPRVFQVMQRDQHRHATAVGLMAHQVEGLIWQYRSRVERGLRVGSHLGLAHHRLGH